RLATSRRADHHTLPFRVATPGVGSIENDGLLGPRKVDQGGRRSDRADQAPAATASAGLSAIAVLRRLDTNTAPLMISTAATARMIRTAVFSCSPTDSVTIAGAINSETRFITLISGLIAGPAVSLNGSPTVSPMTVAACDSEPLPPW